MKETAVMGVFLFSRTSLPIGAKHPLLLKAGKALKLNSILARPSRLACVLNLIVDFRSNTFASLLYASVTFLKASVPDK